ncbi:unnamed protein product [Clonostachys byssicola]|uniref:Uncharacterized protein n=1 Tax=Clonostachys byssicola TaxID=160290 RepID=A0A9N9YCA4_9HYPO|nr:unnamed protein product [Clonostachys byssicola]
MSDNILDAKLAADQFQYGTKPKAMDEKGSVGKHFTSRAAEGAIGGTAQKIGGPLDEQGAIGKQFTTGGSIGGTVQDKMGGQKPT